MKITKSQLERIIKEELKNVLNEQNDTELIIKAAQQATGTRYPITDLDSFVQAVDMAHRDGSFGRMLPNPNEIQAAWIEFFKERLTQMKITKSRLKQIIKEELDSSLREGDLYGGDSPHETLADVKNDPSFHQSPEVPPEVALMEDLWDVVRGFYKLGRSDVALKLQKIAEMADEGHERLVPRGEGTPGV